LHLSNLGAAIELTLRVLAKQDSWKELKRSLLFLCSNIEKNL